jgi:hypothetical protein
LDLNRSQLVSQLKDKHRGFIDSHWERLEPQFAHFYVVYQPNLGSTSSQKVESYHPEVKKFINAQSPLQEAVHALIQNVETWAKSVGTKEAQSLRSYPRLCQDGADEAAFTYLKMTISVFAARKIEREWFEMSATLHANPTADLGSCKCIILLAFGLPCRHYLRRCYASGQPIPRSLVHPRWWLQNSKVHPLNWQPTFPTEEPVTYYGTEERTLQRSLQLDEIRSQLGPEKLSRLRAQEASSTRPTS